jgi:PAS domain S-box-containing protein
LKESEERYRAIFEHAGVLLIELDFSQLEPEFESLRKTGMEGVADYLARNHEYYLRRIVPLIRVVDVNKKTLDMIGAKSKKNILNYFYDRNRDELFTFNSLIIDAIINGRPDIRIDFELTTLRGKKRYVTATATIPVKTQQYDRILVSVTDISERKQFEDALRGAHEELEQRVKERTVVLAETNTELEREIIERKTTESALRESEERYRTLFTTSIDAIWIVDLSMRYVDVNQSLLDLFGFSRGEIIGSEWCMPLYDRSDVNAIKMAIHEKGYAFNTEVRFKRKDGTVLDGLATVTAWRNSSGEIKGYQGFYRDITEQKRAESILKYQAEFQELISKISMNFINIPVDMIDTAIEQTLKTLCEYVHVDHGFIYRNTEGGTRAVLNYEWRHESIDKNDPDLVDTAGTALSWVQEHIKRIDSVDYTDLIEQPSHARSKYYRSLIYREKSFIAVPMVYNGTLAGFFGFDSIRTDKTWDDDTLSLL